jgi:hypothetical protein
MIQPKPFHTYKTLIAVEYYKGLAVAVGVDGYIMTTRDNVHWKKERIRPEPEFCMTFVPTGKSGWPAGQTAFSGPQTEKNGNTFFQPPVMVLRQMARVLLR